LEMEEPRVHRKEVYRLAWVLFNISKFLRNGEILGMFEGGRSPPRVTAKQSGRAPEGQETLWEVSDHRELKFILGGKGWRDRKPLLEIFPDLPPEWISPEAFNPQAK